MSIAGSRRAAAGPQVGLDAEVSWSRRLGARYATEEPLQNNGWAWYVLLDPDGNEFRVPRPPEENRDGLTPARRGQ
jgi:hypothetical protein